MTTGETSNGRIRLGLILGLILGSAMASTGCRSKIAASSLAGSYAGSFAPLAIADADEGAVQIWQNNTASVAVQVVTGEQMEHCADVESFFVGVAANTEPTSWPLACSAGPSQLADVSVPADIADDVYDVRLWAKMKDDKVVPARLPYKVGIDRVPPTLGALKPASSYASGGDIELAIAVGDSLSGVKSVTCSVLLLPDEQVKGESHVDGTTCVLSAPKDYQQRFLIRVRAVDLAGNVATIDSASTIVKGVGPQIDAGPDLRTNVAVTMTAQASSGAALTWRLVNTPAAALLVVATARTAVFGPATVDGVYRIRVTATDDSGQPASDEANVTWDATGPAITLLSGSFMGPARDVAGSVRLFGKVDDDVGTAGASSVSLADGNGDCYDEVATNFSASCPHWIPAGTGADWAIDVATAAFTDGVYAPTIRSLDDLGNASTLAASFTWDAVGPSVASVTINAGAPTANTPKVTVQVTGVAAVAPVETVAFAEKSGAACDFVPPSSEFVDWTAAADQFDFILTRVNGVKTVCAWVRDAAGNVSAVSAAGAGTLGVDVDSISITIPTPPRITSLAIVRHSDASKIFGQGDQMRFSWTIDAAAGLPVHPIVAIEYRATANAVWERQPAANTPSASYGSTTQGDTTWTDVYTGINAPTGGAMLVRFTVEDAIGQRSTTVSELLNGAAWSIWAGDVATYVGVSANNTLLPGSGNITLANIYSRRHNAIFVPLSGAINRIAMDTGIMSPMIDMPGGEWPRIVEGSDGWLYGAVTGKVVRMDPTASTPAWETYLEQSAIGGLTDEERAIWTLSALEFDGLDRLYLVTGGLTDKKSSEARNIIRVGRLPDGRAGPATRIAGTSVFGSAVDGGGALAQPVNVKWHRYASIAPSHDGKIVYVSTEAGSFKLVDLGSGYVVYNLPMLKFGAVTRNKADIGGNHFYSADINSPADTSADMGVYQLTGVLGGPTESLTLIAGANSGVTCDDDGIDALDSCLLAMGGLGFDTGGQIYVMEHGWVISSMSLVVKVLQGDKVYKIFGTRGIQGLGGERNLARFGRLGLLAKDSAGDIYISDGRSMQVAKVVKNGGSYESEVIHYFGTGLQHKNAVIGAPMLGQAMGDNSSSGSGYVIGFDRSDQFYFRSREYLHYVDAGSIVRLYGDADTSLAPSHPTIRWWDRVDGGPFSGGMWATLGRQGFEFDGNGGVYMTSLQKLSTNTGTNMYPAVLRARDDGFGNFTQNVVAGKLGTSTTSNVQSLDGTGPTNALPIRCSMTGVWSSDIALSECTSTGFIRVYDNGGDKVYMADGDRIRVIADVTGVGTFDTLRDGAGVPITDLVAPVSTFVIRSGRLYYHSAKLGPSGADVGGTGAFYCRWLGVGPAPGDCDHTPQFVPSVLRQPNFVGSNDNLIDAGAEGILMTDDNIVLRWDVP